MTRDEPPRIYRYVQVNDNGMAPCPDGRLLTLATCKPMIRRVARPGDWVIGFYSRPWDPGLVSWAARVAARVQHLDYHASHPGRSDAVYKADPETGAALRRRADYHPTQQDMDRDLSGPVLVFDPNATWYFGREPRQLSAALMHLAARGQGHRVNFRESGDLARLSAWLKEVGPPGIYAPPRDAEGCAPCGSRVKYQSSRGC